MKNLKTKITRALCAFLCFATLSLTGCATDAAFQKIPTPPSVNFQICWKTGFADKAGEFMGNTGSRHHSCVGKRPMRHF